MASDIRWKQRFSNYLKAFNELQEGVEIAQRKPLNKLEKQGLIHGFEYAHELAWNVMKDLLVEQGFNNLMGSKDTTRQAFKSGLMPNGEIWMEMIKTRNLTSHTYDESLAEEVFTAIVEKFYPAFKSLADTFSSLHDGEKE
jgi:nucleotidyltransferase substrate binding protein (TIGR01987 family)